MVIALALGGGWGLLVSRVIVAMRGRRASDRRRRALRAPHVVARRRRARLAARLPRPVRVLAGAVVAAVGGLRRVRTRRATDRRFAHQVPVAVDLVRVAVQAGATPYLAVELAAGFAPPAVAEPLGGVLHHPRLGVAFVDALATAARNTPGLRPLTEALALAHRLGSPLGPALERVARDARRELRRRAEARARTVPVRLLFPLVFLVLPAFGLLTVVPSLVAGWHGI